MTEENQNNESEGSSGEKIELDVETYNALIDRLDDLEGKGQIKDSGTGDDVDDLLDEGTRDQQDGDRSNFDLNRASGEELAHYIAEELSNNALNPIAVKLAEVSLEVDAMKLEQQKGYENYRDSEKDILTYLHKHPTLSLKEAYHQVVGKPKVEKIDSDQQDSRKNLLRHLPKVDRSKNAIHGEKPSSVAQSNVDTTGGAMDTRTAALKAIKELNVDFK